MKSETDAFLDLVRHAEQPTQADEVRVRRALQAAVAAGVVASVSVPAGLEASWLGRALAKLGSFGTKLGWLAVCTTALLSSGDTARPPREEARQDTSVAERTAPVPQPSVPQASVPQPSVPQPSVPQPSGPPAAVPPEPAPKRVLMPQEDPAKTTLRSRPPARQNSLRSELDLLERVQAALKRGDGAAALRELEAHASADRMLLAERQAARILALCQLGRVAEARQAADRFAAQHPNSVQRELIAGSCANR